MGNQRIFDTAIVQKTDHSRGIGPRGGTSSASQFLIEPDGTLAACVPINKDTWVIKRSEDNGFTWDDRVNIEDFNESNMTITYSGALNDGASVGLVVALDFSDDGVMYQNNYSMIHTGNANMFMIGTWAAAAHATVWGIQTSKFATQFAGDGGNFTESIRGHFTASDGDGDAYYSIFAQQHNKKLVMIGVNPSASNLTIVLQEYAVHSEVIVSGVMNIKSFGPTVHNVVVTTSPADTLSYIPWAKMIGGATSIDPAQNGSFGSTVVIHGGGGAAGTSSFIEPAIDIDGNGALCVAYNLATSGFYAISNDAGATWDHVHNYAPDGYTHHTDGTSNKTTPCNDVLGGQTGFLVSSLFDKGGSADLFVKQIPTTVASGVVDSPEEWQKVNTVDADVLAGKFFRFTGQTIPIFGDKSGIRMAYQAGAANNVNGQGNVYSTIYHERLSNNAFPTAYSGVSYTNVNINYYASGYISDSTQMYIDKIAELGMQFSFTRYRPLEVAEVNGVSAYGSPETFEFEATVDPGAYGFPTVARGDDDFAEYIARDTRKIFYPPNVYLDREFVLNKGGVLKRTIWLCRIMGNDYEVAQIVPRWLDGSIVYYEANLYVVGPSNDPFSKVILPSES